MPVEVRVCLPEELERFFRTCYTAFGRPIPVVERLAAFVDPERFLVATDEGEMVGTAASFGFATSVPGGVVSAAGVTMVAVLPTHRRRGILTAITRLQLERARAAGDAIAMLLPSESGIYGRYGYGVASRSARAVIAREGGTLRAPPVSGVRARLVDHDGALAAIPGVFDRVRATTPGMHARSADWWRVRTLSDLPTERDGGGPLNFAVVEREGVPEAYAVYRVHAGVVEGQAAGELIVREEVAASPAAAQELWRFLFGVDLVAKIVVPTMRADHPLFFLLQEPRRLRATVADNLWVRILDIERALTARRYGGSGTLVFHVTDDLLAANTGRWRLDADGSATLTQTTEEPHLRLSIADLASAYLGGISFAELSQAGRVEVLRPDAIQVADQLFRHSPAPWCPEVF